MTTIYVVKGHVTSPDAHLKPCSVGDTEWQFSDGPPGKRSSSADYLNLEEGIQSHRNNALVFVKSANDRLIAASPMLLEALRAILAYEDDLPCPDTYGAEVYAKARAAIAKAEA